MKLFLWLIYDAFAVYFMFYDPFSFSSANVRVLLAVIGFILITWWAFHKESPSKTAKPHRPFSFIKLFAVWILCVVCICALIFNHLNLPFTFVQRAAASAVIFLSAVIWGMYYASRPASDLVKNMEQTASSSPIQTVPQPDPSPRPRPTSTTRSSPTRFICPDDGSILEDNDALEDDEPQDDEYEHTFFFRVAGVTFKNEDGTDRQTILRHLKFSDPPYVQDDKPALVLITETEYNFKTAFEVTINGYLIGYVPREHIRQMQKAQAADSWDVADCEIYGGAMDENGERHSYGCKITVKYYTW